jgi:hypothetical protein
MRHVIVRLILLAAGLGLVEIGLVPALYAGSASAWLALAVGLILLIGGTAGFMIPVLSSDAGRDQRP